MRAWNWGGGWLWWCGVSGMLTLARFGYFFEIVGTQIHEDGGEGEGEGGEKKEEAATAE